MMSSVTHSTSLTRWSLPFGSTKLINEQCSVNAPYGA